MPTTTRGYEYPDSSGHDRLWEHFETLADDIDTDVGTLSARLLAKPVGRIKQTVGQSSLTDATNFAVTFDAEDYDTGGFHSTSSNTSRVTPNVAGYYRFRGVITFGGQSDFVNLDAFFRLNGSTVLQGANRISAPSTNTTVTTQSEIQYAMNGSTDYMELIGRADRTGNAVSTTVVSSFLGSILEWEWIRPL